MKKEHTDIPDEIKKEAKKLKALTNRAIFFVITTGIVLVCMLFFNPILGYVTVAIALFIVALLHLRDVYKETNIFSQNNAQ